MTINFLIVAESEPSSKSKGVIIGIAVGCGILFVALAGAAAYAFIQRRRAQKAKEELGGPFGMFCVMFSSSDNIVPHTETDDCVNCPLRQRRGLGAKSMAARRG